jgi:hypothetical protein
MPSFDELCASIDARIAQARSEITSLQAARDALHPDGAAPLQTTPGRTTRRAKAPAALRSPKITTAARRATEAADTPPASAASELETEPSRNPAATPRKPQSRRGRTPARRRKSVEVLLTGRLDAMLREAEGGLSAVAIAKAANARNSQVRELLSERESAGQVRRTGTGRGTRWRLITDEERVAARAAELEKRRTAKS